MTDVNRLVDRHLTRATDDSKKLCRYALIMLLIVLLAAGLTVAAVVLLHQLGAWPAVAGLGGTTSTLGIAKLALCRRGGSEDKSTPCHNDGGVGEISRQHARKFGQVRSNYANRSST